MSLSVLKGNHQDLYEELKLLSYNFSVVGQDIFVVWGTNKVRNFRMHIKARLYKKSPRVIDSLLHPEKHFSYQVPTNQLLEQDYLVGVREAGINKTSFYNTEGKFLHQDLPEKSIEFIKYLEGAIENETILSNSL